MHHKNICISKNILHTVLQGAGMTPAASYTCYDEYSNCGDAGMCDWAADQCKKSCKKCWNETLKKWTLDNELAFTHWYVKSALLICFVENILALEIHEIRSLFNYLCGLCCYHLQVYSLDRPFCNICKHLDLSWLTTRFSLIFILIFLDFYLDFLKHVSPPKNLHYTQQVY